MKKVLLGMSGGVDSSVSAILLKEQGYDVIGITLELFGGTCCNTDAIVGAKQICNSIGIPHITYNLKEEFQCKVINNFIDEYSNQRTPNPCIECNKYMKFGAMYEKAKELGCDYIATGHYAKMEYSDEYGKYVLRKAQNSSKDQSYVLYNMPKQLLGKVLFPLGNFESKEDVRKIAKEHKVPVTLLCDTNHVLSSDYSEVIVVGAGADAVDYKLISICCKGDIVVSQDYGVAAMALGKGAYAIHQSGKWYTNDNIDQMLMERHLNKKARRSSHKNHIKGPKRRTEEDDERFAQSFEKMLLMAQEKLQMNNKKMGTGEMLL